MYLLLDLDTFVLLR